MKKPKEIKRLQDSTIKFIKDYMIEELQIKTLINEDILQDIENKCFEYSDEFAEKELNPNYVITNEEKCHEADRAEADIFNVLENYICDYNDLNNRLGL